MKNFKPIGIIVNKYQMGTGKNGIQSSEKEYRGVLPFEEIVVFPTQREQRNLAARRMEQATTSYQDFSKAQDVDPDKRAEFTRKQRILLYVTTCLTASIPLPEWLLMILLLQKLCPYIAILVNLGILGFIQIMWKEEI